MLKYVALFALLGATFAAPPSGKEVQILRLESDIDPEGSYRWGYELDDGTKGDEQGTFQAKGPEEGELSAQGSFAWISPEGEKIDVSYVADANGYQPQGSHIPTPPPIPPAIQRALEWIAAHPEPEQSLTGQKKY